MSSKFAVIHPNKDILNKGNILYEELLSEDDYTIIGSSHLLVEHLEPLILRLPKDTPIVCIDNETDFKTLGDYLESLKYKF